MATPPLIAYTRAPLAWYRRRRVQRCAILLAILLLAWWLWIEVPEFYHQANVAYWEHQLAYTSLPPGTPVSAYDPPPAIIAAMASPFTSRLTHDGHVYVTRSCPTWSAYCHASGLFSEPWYDGTVPCVYVHEMADTRGQRWLLRLFATRIPGEKCMLDVRYDLATPQGISGGPDYQSSLTDGGGSLQLLTKSPTSPLMVFAGQPDPADPTHATVPFTSGGQKGLIDIVLRGTGRYSEARVDLTVRVLPTAPP